MACWPASPRRKQGLPLLTPEHLLGLPVFARNFFREFFGRTKPPSVLVFDNYQDAGSGSQIDLLQPVLVQEIPPGCMVIVISRTDPRPVMARHLVAKDLAVIDCEALRLTDDETQSIARAYSQSAGREHHRVVV